LEKDTLSVGEIENVYTQTGKLTGYRCELIHHGLNEHALLRAPDTYILQNKIHAKVEVWAEKWSRVDAKRQLETMRGKNKSEADRLTAMAEETLRSARSLLKAALDVDDAVDWKALEDKRPFIFEETSKFPDVEFDKSGRPINARLLPSPQPPDTRSLVAPLKLNFFDKLLPWMRDKKVLDHANALQAEKEKLARQEAAYLDSVEVQKQQNKVRQAALESARASHASAMQAFKELQDAANQKIWKLHDQYQQKEPNAVVQNCELVLNNSNYPDFFSKEFELEFNPDSQILIVDYALPPKSRLPTISKVAYVQSRDELKVTHLSESDVNKLFDEVLFQVALRTLHELHEGDTAGALAAVVFNGWVEDTNPATGQLEKGCLLSAQATKDQLANIDLAKVEPRACFKLLKGVAASKLSGMQAVRPILRMKREDARFVSSYDVAGKLDDGVNLAAMDWEDFEHLIRELFAKEFAFEGAE
jgi:restriction system protein